MYIRVYKRVRFCFKYSVKKMLSGCIQTLAFATVAAAVIGTERGSASFCTKASSETAGLPAAVSTRSKEIRGEPAQNSICPECDSCDEEVATEN